MVDVAEFERWRQAAEDTRRAARIQGDSGIHNWACFLAEQAAQLALKGLLHGIGAGAWGHDLLVLGQAVSSSTGRALPPEIESALRRLSRHYIPARYPDAHPSGPPGLYYGASDVEQALADLEAVHQFADGLWDSMTMSSDSEDDR